MWLNIYSHPLALTRPERLEPPFNWQEHIPFAMVLVDLMRPRLFVELGTHSGNSYCAFCQAIHDLHLATQAYAVDTWEGDGQAGSYSEDVLDQLRSHHDPRYGGFSRLLQSTFDEALQHFDDGSIDLLHIDGLHTYEAVQHDFYAWLPKMSGRGIVVLHDVNVRERDFGVYRLWEEIAARFPHFMFLHGNGLGVVAVGTEIPEALVALFQADIETTAYTRQLFAQLGYRLTQEAQAQQQLRAAAAYTEQVQRRELESAYTAVSQRDSAIVTLQEQIHLSDAHLHNLEKAVQSSESHVDHLKNAMDQQHAHLQDELQQRDQHMQQREAYIQHLQQHQEHLQVQLQQRLEQIQQQEQAFQRQELRIQEQEQAFQQQELRIQEQEQAFQQQELRIQEQELRIQEQEQVRLKLEHGNTRIQQQDLQLHQLNDQLVTQHAQFLLFQRQVAEQQSGIGWATISKLRTFRWKALPAGSWRNNVYLNLRKVVITWRKHGPVTVVRKGFARPVRRIGLRRIADRLSTTDTDPARAGEQTGESGQVPDDTLFMRSSDPLFSQWLDANVPTRSELQQQHELAKDFVYRPLISVITPCYNVDAAWLRKCIDSVLRQTYPYWELCIVDDHSTQAHVRPLLENYAAQDARIKVRFAAKNSGIATTSNACLELAEGEFVALLDNDDELAPHALFSVVERIQHENADIIYSDEDKLTLHNARENPHFKPDFSPDFLLSNNYICHLLVIRRQLVESVGGFQQGYDGAQDYDLVLRVAEHVDRRKILHIPDILYHWRAIPGSTAMDYGIKPKARDASLHLLNDYLKRIHGDDYGFVQPSKAVGIYDVSYALKSHPLVSIIICSKDKVSVLKKCIDSLCRTTYENYEVIIVDNGSREAQTKEYYASLEHNERITVVSYDKPFNYSAQNNFGIRHAQGEVILLLNNDTEVITPAWIEQMLGLAQQQRVGVVGAKLLFPNRTIQHAGVILGLGGIAGHAHKHFSEDAPGYFNALRATRNYAAVTGACMMFRRDVWEQVGGLSEELSVLFNDVDFCLKVGEAGYDIVYTPHAVLWHHESVSLGRIEKKERVIDIREVEYIRRHWGTLVVHDPFYNPNLSLLHENFAIEPSRRRPITYTKYNPGFRVDPAVIQEHYDRPVGDLYDGHRVRQRIVAPKPNLFAIEVLPGTHGRKNEGFLHVSLSDEQGAPLHEWVVPVDALSDNNWYRFTMDLIEESAGQTYWIDLYTERSVPDRAITVWQSTRSSAYLQGELYIDDVLQSGSLAFRAFFLTPQ